MSSQTPEQVESLKLKEQGNAAYKQRQFEQAEQLYLKAHETFQDPTYLNNLAGELFLLFPLF
jgi:Flp pilus assembly protein TadD